ncbi:MAG: DUF3786 domain-containing protein [Thermodesulfobacteriota bacterium]
MENLDKWDVIYWDYVKQVAERDLSALTDRLGVTVKGNSAIVPLFGKEYRISGQGIVDHAGNRPSHSVSVVLCKYLLLCPSSEPTQTDLVTYKDFPDAGPFVGGFLNNVEKPIGRTFACRVSALERACRELGGRDLKMHFPADLAVRFDALPKIPLVMLYYDQDEEFPPHCSVLFERRAEKYLDMECLAIVGWILAEWLIARVDSGSSMLL